MIYKVKEPLPHEWQVQPGQILYTYLHLAAASRELTEAMIEADIRAIAFETVETGHGHPLLFPMSEVAGKLAIQAGATHLQKNHGGRACCSAASPACRRPRSSSSAAARWASTRPRWRWASRAHRRHGQCADRARLPGRRVRRPHGDGAQQRGGNRGGDRGRRPGRRSRVAARRRPGAAPGQAVDAQENEAGLGAGRRGHRPGRMLRDVQAHHAQRAHVRRRRHHPLLCRQHARRRGSHLDHGAHRRHAALRHRDRQQGLRGGRAGRRRWRWGSTSTVASSLSPPWPRRTICPTRPWTKRRVSSRSWRPTQSATGRGTRRHRGLNARWRAGAVGPRPASEPDQDSV